jgi:2,5-diketo-D-gluconate reductase A
MTNTSGVGFTEFAWDLPDGVRMPLLGFGTWQISGRRATDAVSLALQAGYRHIDTATMYGNESQVGAALEESGLPREQVFVTTKLPPQRAGRERQTLLDSLRALGTDYVDLWLIHWPPGRSAGVESWRAFVQARADGLTRAIGVSNYSLAQIDELTGATGVVPAVNQVRWSPFQFDRRTLDESRARGVELEGYSPFRAGRLDHPVLEQIAARHSKTAAQIVVRWHLQHGIAVIPKSARRERIISNADVFDFELSGEEMSAIDGLSRSR